MYQESVVAMYTDGDLGVSVGGNMCLGPIGDVELLRVMVGKCNISWLMIGAMVPVVSGGEMDTDGH